MPFSSLREPVWVESVDGMLWLSPQGMLVLAQARWVFQGSSATVRFIFVRER
jgi:hypothetical protein